MDYRLLNEIEKVIEAASEGPTENYDFSSAADTMCYMLEDVLEDKELTSQDWTIICANIQAGMANAAAKAIRRLACVLTPKLIGCDDSHEH